MLALLMTFLGTSNVSADSWEINFVGLVSTDKTAVDISTTETVTIGGVTLGTCSYGETALDSKFVIQTGTSWLLRTGTTGLYQFNSGNRSFGLQDCKAGQIITITGSGDPNPATNATLKSSSGNTYVYTVTDDGGVRFNPARNLSFQTIKVEDPSADEVNYTVKYMCGTTEVKPSTTGSGKPGDPITLSDTEKQNYYTSDNTAGYIYESDDSGSKTIAADGSTVVTVSFRKAKVMTCKINAMIDGDVADKMTCGDFEGKTTSVSYHQFILKDGRLYEADVENNEYNLHFVMDGTDQEIEYRPTSFTNVVYFSEAEDIAGMKWSESANANIRCSFGAGAYNDGEAPVYATTLPAGIYRISAQVWGNTGETLKVELGENVLACETTGSRVAYIADFTINEETDLMIPVCGNSSKMLDWIFVQKIGDVEPAKDLYIIGSGTPSDWTTTTPMTLNAETNAYEYELTLSGKSYFAIGDAAFTDWDDFNTHRYGLSDDDVVVPIDTPKQLEKHSSGALVIETAGVYKVSITKDMVMTITKTADVTATVEKVQIKGATDSEWSNQITVDLTEGEENVYTGVLDPAGSTNDVEFKLVVNDGSWIGYNELTLDAPDGWAVAQSGDKSNFVLKNSDTGFKNYTVTATWVPNADFVANWTLKIEGKDKNATELEVPGTVIWSSEEPQTVDWNNGKSIVIPKENLADVKVGDVLNIGVLGAPEGASPSNWSYQIGLQDPSESGWKWIEANLPLNQGGDYVHSIAITGDMLKLMQADGVAINGTAFNVKKVAVESKYSGSDKSIWVGDETLTGWPPATIYPVHFEIANDFEGVKEGQIIRVNCTPAAGLALKYQGESTEWGIVDFPGLDLSSCATETGYDVPVTADMVSILKANRFLLFGDGTVKATSVELIDAPAAEPEVVSIFVFPDNGSDIYEAYAAEAKKVTDAGNIVGYVHIQLSENGNYTISNTIKASVGIRIYGGFSTVDASALEGNMIEFATLEDPTEWVNTMVDIQHLNVKGLKKSLFCSNSKNYVVETFLIHDCMIEQAGDATTIDFTKGSTALNMIVQYSTFYAPTKTTKSFYSSQGGQKATDYDASALQKFTFQYNTMYNLAPTKNFFSHRQSNQKWMAYDIKNNIFVDCGKSGQVIRGFNGGQGGSNPTWTISGNLFNFEGADTSASESTGDDAEPVSDSVEGVITFTDPTAPDFSGSIELSPSATEPALLGDPRWTLTYGGGDEGEGDATDLLAEIEEAKKLLKYSMPYYDENNEESPETEGKALVDAIRDAEEKAEGGTSQKKLDKMLEELKQAEIDYTTALMDYELAESEAILAGADPADELAAEIQRLYDTQDVVREDYSNQPKHIKNYADEIDKAQKAYLRKAINELIPEAQAMASDPAVQNALDKANEALEGDSSEDLFDALNGLLEAMETATGIRGIEANDTDDAPVYNMGGQRVSSNAKGIVIKNGKKIIRK